MPSFASYDGTELQVELSGAPGEPLVCLPGGPLRAPRYLGDLGGLDAHRELVLLQLPPRRVDKIVGDVEALRAHLGRERVDILAHSAAGNLALLYAAAYPQHVKRMALVTPTARAVGVGPSDEDVRAALGRRSGEPWYPAARQAVDALVAGDQSPANRRAVAPFLYSRWDSAAQSHAAAEAEQTPANARATYYGEGAFDTAATRAALRHVAAPVLVLAGSLDFEPTVRAANELAGLFPNASVAVQPAAGHFPWLDDAVAFVELVRAFFG
jgi:pimeloyl-ACP methyl ester carboxylesterase